MSLDADPPAQICFKNAILDGGSGKASIRVRRGRFEIVLWRVFIEVSKNIIFNTEFNSKIKKMWKVCFDSKQI